MRIGYVSADLCQHTVGLFLNAVLQAHDPSRVELFAYSAGSVSDWVTQAIRKRVTFREVATVSDAELSQMIQQDGIDVLVDLSGHITFGCFNNTAKLNDGGLQLPRGCSDAF